MRVRDHVRHDATKNKNGGGKKRRSNSKKKNEGKRSRKTERAVTMEDGRLPSTYLSSKSKLSEFGLCPSFIHSDLLCFYMPTYCNCTSFFAIILERKFRSCLYRAYFTERVPTISPVPKEGGAERAREN